MGALQSMVSWRTPRLSLASNEPTRNFRAGDQQEDSVHESPAPSTPPLTTSAVEPDAGAAEAADDRLSISRLRREQLIDRIITVNVSATASFLDAFSTDELDEYYAHLECASRSRGRGSRWVRPSKLPGISMSESRG